MTAILWSKSPNRCKDRSIGARQGSWKFYTPIGPRIHALKAQRSLRRHFSVYTRQLQAPPVLCRIKASWICYVNYVFNKAVRIHTVDDIVLLEAFYHCQYFTHRMYLLKPTLSLPVFRCHVFVHVPFPCFVICITTQIQTRYTWKELMFLKKYDVVVSYFIYVS